MKKKYLNFKDYFVDKKQAKQFKKWNGDEYLFAESIVFLSNNQTTKDLELNINHYKNTTIIIKNSSFNQLKIVENNKNNNRVILEKTKINNGEIILSDESNFEIIDSTIRNIKIYNSNEVNFKCIKNNDLYDTSNIEIIQSKNININNVNGNIKIIISGENINISNSNLLINEINSNNQLIITTSKIRHQLLNYSSGIIFSNNLTAGGLTEIGNCYVKTVGMNVLSNSYLFIQNSYFDISNNFDINNYSYVEDNHFKDSIFDCETINILPDSGIDIKGIEYSNNSNETVQLEFNNLKQGRKKLIKTLHLISDKFNPIIKELE